MVRPAGSPGTAGSTGIATRPAFRCCRLFEKANQDPAEFVARLRRASYAGEFGPIFGDTVLAEPDKAFEAALEAGHRGQQLSPPVSRQG
jgi:cytochrome c peroxidase